MDLNQAIQTYQPKLRNRSVGFLVQEDTFLVGKKKEGFGKDMLIGIGGKQKDNETLEETLAREINEEIHVSISDFSKVAIMEFYFPFAEEPLQWSQRVHFYTITSWRGEPTETDEILPIWLNNNEVDFNKMWDDHKYWFQSVLNSNKSFKGSFLYGNDTQNVTELKLAISL